MALIKRSHLHITRTGIIYVILLAIVVYYISTNFLQKIYSATNGFRFYSLLDEDQSGVTDIVSHLVKNSQSKVFHGEKLIHLDLKGAPPSVSYLKEFFPYIKSLGATGVLIEYEDMFFYKDELEDIRALNAYQPSVLEEILELAEFNNLSVIPLIQTFGHLEFVLKLEKYEDLREVKEYPQVLCPSHGRVLSLIKKMIDQILEAHPKAKYIHIGCDEVMYLGQCDKCKTAMRDHFWTSAQLFLNHVENIAMYINETYPGVRPIIWGDMIARFNERILKKSQISQLLDLMVWKYLPNVSQYITEDLLEMYARVFRTIWIASAFKGATGSTQIKTDIKYHLANHVAWLKLVNMWKNHLHFKGIAITGWQRYDHFAQLCELLPVAIPSLTASLYYFNNPEAGFNESKILKILQCNPLYEISLFSFTYSGNLGKCNFPGFTVYELITRFSDLSTKITENLSTISSGWLSFYNILHKFSSPAYVIDAFHKWPLYEHLQELKNLEKDLIEALSEIYDEFTVEEWITTNIIPIRLRLEMLYRVKQSLLKPKVWSRRPFLNITDSLIKVARGICTSENNIGCALLMF